MDSKSSTKIYSIIDNKNELAVNIKCGHVTSLNYMKEWINNHKTCVICSNESSLNDVVKIYYDNTINEKYSKYYREMLEKLQRDWEYLKIDNDICSSTIKLNIDRLEYEVEYKKNKKLKNLLYQKIEDGSDFIDQNAIEDLIQLEMKTKDEEINILKLKIFDALSSQKISKEKIINKEKIIELENKLKYQEEEKNKYVSKLCVLEDEYNKLEKENLLLKDMTSKMDCIEKLERKLKHQEERIIALKKENEVLNKDEKHRNEAISKLNKKLEKKTCDLQSQYQELKMITELLEYKMQSFDDIERNLYEFDKNICKLMTKIVPSALLTEEPFLTFFNKPQKIGSPIWQMISKKIFSKYGSMINEIGENVKIVRNIIQNDISIPWSLIDDIEIVPKINK
ncbi:Zinc finger, RING/FYVE/PHD-type domain-containing protein [Strongyloides ratti]|uniref:Zinc finger, RING/FYVE/PHD-type domain-containing protein n=1 Tax=Strongyloides ratti TaxID=34506 RepID=A0A090L2M0_STRRB|nr:Zinc finger, RING/FYVE/PHD-type domain-containing protein [Strongyloides ratti]CEF62352.1 Zinc finger, RING/FYVE/PHD-type domain-containing protein [Strongyloides ratti]